MVSRLSQLLGRARARIAGSHEPRWSQVARFVVVLLPAAPYRLRWWTLGVAVAFVAIAVVSGWWVATNPAALDAMGGCALMVEIANRQPHENTEQVMHRFLKIGTIDLRVDFLRQGMGQHFVASAEVTRLGGRVGSTQMRLVNDSGELIATAAAAYIVS